MDSKSNHAPSTPKSYEADSGDEFVVASGHVDHFPLPVMMTLTEMLKKRRMVRRDPV